MEKIIIKTKKGREIVDITEKINSLLKKKKITEGICYISLLHTTAAVTTADFDPETDLDVLSGIEMVTTKKELEHLKHLLHVPANIIASFLGSSVILLVKHSQLVLGKWQRVMLIELNGPRKREVMIMAVEKKGGGKT